MKQVFRHLTYLLILFALLTGICYMLWPYSFADLQPECDSINVWRVGYWGDHASLAMMAEFAAVLGKQEKAEILGHASAEFSLDVYTHVTAGMKKDAAQKISGFMASVG